MRIVVLVGAGASFGAFENADSRPPLGNWLFDRLVDEFPESWGCLPDTVTTAFRTEGVELGMAALREAGDATQRALIDMSIFFVDFTIPPYGVNRYFALVRMLDHLDQGADYVFGSLNYEMLLEMSLNMAGHGVVYWEPATDSVPSPIRVVKPHGSANFAPAGVNFKGVRMSGVGTYIAGASLTVIEPDQVHGSVETGLMAAMSLYAPGKPDLICPEAVGRLRADWAEVVGTADALVVVGARPMVESDPHIWSPILDSMAPIGYVGGEAEECDRLFGERVAGLGATFAAGLEGLRSWLGALTTED